MDHAYGSFYQTSKEELESLLSRHVSSFHEIDGVPGMDITKSIYDTEVFDLLFGDGNLRYLCKK